MANFSALKTSIQNAIKQNGNEEITGNVLQQILLSIVSTMGDGAINTIEQNLSSETLARQNGDNTLQSNINAEALARGNADTQLQNAINAIKANIDNGYVYAGIATPTATPVSGKVFYIATAAGTYTNFGGQVLTQGINILRYNGSAWSNQQLIGIDDAPTAGSNSLVKSGGVQNELALGAVYDVSAKNPTAGPNNDGKWESLSALFSDANLNTLIPTAYRKGGMSIKFVHTNDNKYVQYRFALSTFTDLQFINPLYWVDDLDAIRPVVRNSSADFSEDVLELYVIDSPYQTLRLQSGSAHNQALLFQNDAADGIVARTDVGVIIANNEVYPIKITKTNDSTNYPIGKVIALIVFNNYQSFLDKGSASTIVPIKMEICKSLHYSPICAEYLLNVGISNLNTTKADKTELTALAETVANKADKSTVTALSGEVDELSDDVSDVLESYDDKDVWEENAESSGSAWSSGSLTGKGNAIAENKTIHKLVVSVRNSNYTTYGKATKLKLVLRKDTASGDVLIQKIVDIDYNDDDLHNVIFDFTDNPVTYSGVIFATIQGNNPIKAVTINDSDYDFDAVLVSTTSKDLTVEQPFSISGVQTGYLWVKFVSKIQKVLSIDTDNIKDSAVTEEKLSEEVQQKINTPSHNNGVRVVLPSDIVVVAGSTLQLFYRGIVSAVNPYNYNIETTVISRTTGNTIGNAYPRYYQLKATNDNVGVYDITVKVRDNDNTIISERSGVIRVIAAPSAPASQKNILVFGASVVTTGDITGEISRRLTANTGTVGDPVNPKGLNLSNISFIGSKIGSNVAIHQEATGGMGWYAYSVALPPRYRFFITDGSGSNIAVNETFVLNSLTFTVKEINITSGSGNISCSYTGTISGTVPASGVLPLSSGNVNYSSYVIDTENPFWNPNKLGTNKLDFGYYADTYCNGASIDILVSQLGVNDMASGTGNMNNLIDNVKTIARAYHTYCTNNNIDGKFIISTIAVPDMRGGFGYNYHADGAKSNYYTILRKFFEFSEAIEELSKDEEFSSYIVHAPVMQECDGENMYPYTEMNVNNRCETKEKIGINAYHPNRTSQSYGNWLVGYYLIADSIYQSVCDVLDNS